MPFPKASAGPAVRALFYNQLATLLAAGVPVLRAVEQLARSPAHRGLRRPAFDLLDGLKGGMGFGEAFAGMNGWAPAFDLALITAGERSGTLDRTFRTLERHHRERAQNLRTVRSECLYPALVLHLALLIAPLPGFVRHGNVLVYLSQSVGVMLVLHAGVAFAWWSLQGGRGPAWRAWIEAILHRVPVVGAARQDLAVARLAGALESLLGAGILVTEAWPLAASASGSPRIERAVAQWPDDLAAGLTPGELVAASGIFPESLASAYLTGEISGRLEEQLAWLARHHEEEGFRGLRILSQWSPRIAYALIAVYIAFQILALAGGYVGMLDQLLDG